MSFSFNLVSDRKNTGEGNKFTPSPGQKSCCEKLVCRVSLDVAGLTLFISLIFLHEDNLEYAVYGGSSRKQLRFLHLKKNIDLKMVK